MDRINISWDQDIATNYAEVEKMVDDAALALGLQVEFRKVSFGRTRQEVSFAGKLDDPDPKAVALMVAQTLDERLRSADANRITVSVDHTLLLSI